MPAYAAFQDWQAICRFSNPVIIKSGSQKIQRQGAIFPFSTGMDPVARAGEVLSALIYRRGDVKKGSSLVGVRFADEVLISSSSLDVLLEYVVPLFGSGKLSWLSAEKEWHQNTSYIKQKGIVVDDNSSVLTSSTRELSLDPGKLSFKVITPKTEAIVFDRPVSNEKLGSVSILQATGESMISVSSIANGDIVHSDRLLIVFATDAINSGAVFSGDRKQLLRLGKLPVLIKNQSVILSIENKNYKNLKLYALNMKGQRVETLPFKVKKNGVVVTLNLSELKNGPTAFFELVKE
jgi:hypothetical protein